MRKSKNIGTIREQIDKVDDQINELLSRRAELAVAIGEIKGGRNIYRPSRETSILRKVSEHHLGLLPESSVKAIFSEIIAASRNLESCLRVACLGPVGSYSCEAAVSLVGSTSEIVPAVTMNESVRMTEAGDTDAALIPIENSIEGSVMEAHKLLTQTNLRIIAETEHQIQHCLLSKAKNLEQVKTVYGHQQALCQCREWLRSHMPKVELSVQPSTSRAAELSVSDTTTAAVASGKLASKLELRVLSREISDQPNNRTRFLLLGTAETEPTGNDKTSIICSTADEPGALYRLLGIFEAHEINLTRLQSLPGLQGEYNFYIDFSGHEKDNNVMKAVLEIHKITRNFKMLGSFARRV